jgi:hypothetical protein
MVYNPAPPYEVLRTRLMDFADLARVRRFAAFWDIFGNSGNFTMSLPLLWNSPPELPTESPTPSAFRSFLQFSDALHQQGVRTSGIALPRQYELLGQHLLSVRPGDTDAILSALAADYRRPGRRDLPPFLAPRPVPVTAKPQAAPTLVLPPRQARHSRVTPDKTP